MMMKKLEAVGYMVALLGALLACGNGKTAGSDAPQTQEQKCGGKHVHASDCKPLMRARLKDPDSADFAGVFDATFDTAADCTQTYQSSVKAKNGFGLVVKTDFVCTYNPKTKAIAIRTLP